MLKLYYTYLYCMKFYTTTTRHHPLAADSTTTTTTRRVNVLIYTYRAVPLNVLCLSPVLCDTARLKISMCWYGTARVPSTPKHDTNES